jgi:hypothetical protein
MLSYLYHIGKRIARLKGNLNTTAFSPEGYRLIRLVLTRDKNIEAKTKDEIEKCNEVCSTFIY